MNNRDFITKYAALGRRILRWTSGEEAWPEMDMAVRKGETENRLFTPYMQKRALQSIACAYLDEKMLSGWLSGYPRPDRTPHMLRKPVCAVIAAGNIPAVAFHDILCVIASGMKPAVKLSSKDRYLLPLLFGEADFTLDEQSILKLRPDALLAMGGDSAAEHFREAFDGIPSLIRAGRFSAAAVRGDEPPSGLQALAEDMLLYYGLGCRSVTCLLIPEGYAMEGLAEAINSFSDTRLGPVARNNYLRNRAIATMSGEKFIDTGTMILKELPEGTESNVKHAGEPPVAEAWYASYRDETDIEKFIEANKGGIQKFFRNFGTAQQPSLDDYPDGKDTLEFLVKVKKTL